MLVASFNKLSKIIDKLIDDKKGFDVEVSGTLQNIYNNCVSSLLESEFDCISCPKCEQHFHNCKLGDIFNEHYEYERNIVLNNVKITVWFQRVKCPKCGGTHAIIPDCIIPYSQLTLKEAITVLEFEFNYNEESYSPSPLVEPYVDKIVLLFQSYFDDYRFSFDLTADKTVGDLIEMLIDDPFHFIRNFFDKCKKLFLVNRRILIEKNDSEKKVTAIYLNSVLI